jgi:deazaflavin-dependent oxidoreductase (nitroreductase family)
MTGAVLMMLAVLVLALLAIAILYVLGIRSKSATVRAAARRFHHGVGNPLQLRSAGTPASYAAVIRHQGRRTGRTYGTPVWAVPTEDGFVIAIVYGSGTDWLKNVLASGAAAIVHHGETCLVDQPELVPIQSARAYFPATLQRTHRLVGVEECLRVRRVKVARTSTARALGIGDRRSWARRASTGAIGAAGAEPRMDPWKGAKEETMNQQGDDQVIPYSKSRHFMEEAIRSTHHKPMMHGLLEVDVTTARAYLREVKARTGASPSFTAFIIGCLGRAVDEHKDVHALRKGNRHLVLFGEVDVLTWIEREIAGQPQVLPCIVRAANHKTFREIHDEIRAAQVQDVAKTEVGGAKASQLLPAWLFRPYFSVATRIGRRFPRAWKQSWGTVTLSAVGMVGNGAGWGIPPSSPSICWITVGGIGPKREDVDGQLITRDYLSLTVSFDHNLVDGAPAARFTERFKELIESGYGLIEQERPVRNERRPQPQVV